MCCILLVVHLNKRLIFTCFVRQRCASDVSSSSASIPLKNDYHRTSIGQSVDEHRGKLLLRQRKSLVCSVQHRPCPTQIGSYSKGYVSQEQPPPPSHCLGTIICSVQYKVDDYRTIC
ncbi:hypothetical protein GHT06_022338 [Daphnia sinensis]|uniref:Uncharacterized protein n=1 Tax=Daphnia sinensis TaxID=1820382 RepID=A0AAD5PLJ5_9CRUS|nr:hypothetical protein GHT06_022338 [Daphnia sinensis]